MSKNRDDRSGSMGDWKVTVPGKQEKAGNEYEKSVRNQFLHCTWCSTD